MTESVAGSIDLREDDLTQPEIQALLSVHRQQMLDASPPESAHVFSADQLRQPGIQTWTAWRNDQLLGCGALKEIDTDHGEVKSMHSARAARNQGIGAAILIHILTVAKARGYQRVSLETGSMDAFIPARNLYEKHGFVYCPPFADYVPDPNSVFMTLILAQQKISATPG